MHNEFLHNLSTLLIFFMGSDPRIPTTMADAFRNQLNDPKFKEVPFEDRLGMLVDIEYSNRKNNRQKQLIRNAGFDQPEANIMDINYTSGRKLNKDLINRLATCEYVS